MKFFNFSNKRKERQKDDDNEKSVAINLVTESRNGFYCWNGNVYKSDIVRSAIRPKAQAIGKLVPKHIFTKLKNDKNEVYINPEIYIRYLLEEPNPLMTGQQLQEKLTTLLMLNNNAFALIVRDNFGLPMQLYPINASNVEALYISNQLHLKFYFSNGKIYTFPYSDIIHLRRDFADNEIFGSSMEESLKPLMDIVTTTDQGLIKAIKNGSIIRWLLKTTTSIRPEAVTKLAQNFAKDFLSLEGDAVGVAATDAKTDAQQVEPKDYVPNALTSNNNLQRIFNLFNTNEKIIQSKYSEDDWNSYYEAEIEPLAIQFSKEYSKNKTSY